MGDVIHCVLQSKIMYKERSMNKIRKILYGNDNPADYYLWDGMFSLVLILGVIGFIFARGEQKWAGVFGIGGSLYFLIALRLFR
jgi:hypothetical protein